MGEVFLGGEQEGSVMNPSDEQIMIDVLERNAGKQTEIKKRNSDDDGKRRQRLEQP